MVDPVAAGTTMVRHRQRRHRPRPPLTVPGYLLSSWTLVRRVTFPAAASRRAAWIGSNTRVDRRRYVISLLQSPLASWVRSLHRRTSRFQPFDAS